MATPSYKGYQTSVLAGMGNEEAIRNSWSEVPGYEMFANTGATTTSTSTDTNDMSKNKEVEIGLGVSVYSPMSDSQKKDYLDSLTDEQYRQMRTYKNQGYSFEASRTLLENSEGLANPTANGVAKYNPKGNFFRNIVGGAGDSATGVGQFIGNTAADIIGRTAKKLGADEDRVNYLVDDFKNYLEESKISKSVKANTNSLGYKGAKLIGDLGQVAAGEGVIKGAMEGTKVAGALSNIKNANLLGKVGVNALEGAADMGLYNIVAESELPSGKDLAVGAVLGGALPIAGAGVKAGKNLVKKEAGAGAEKLIEKVTKISPAKLQKFENQFGENVGKFMNDRGLKDRKEIGDYFINNVKKVDEALGSIEGTFKSPVVDDVLAESVEFATKTADENLNRLLELQQKAANEGLTMSEVNEVKRYFEGHTKFTYGKSQDAVKASKATNLDTRLREWQMQMAKESGLDNLPQLNRETQASRYILDNAKDAQQGILGAVDVTDELLAIHYGGLDRALSTYVTKSLLKSSVFQKKLVDILNRLSGHTNMEAIVADLNAISKVNTEKEFEALMKKRELDPALPAPKEGAINDAGYNILQRGEDMVSGPNGETIIKDSITEIPQATKASRLDFSTKGEGFAKLRKDGGDYMIMSVENPMGQMQSAELNKKATEEFRKFLDENGIEWKAQKGMYGNPENSQIIAIDNAQQRSIIDKRAEANNVPQAENIIVKDGYAYRYDPRTYEAYKVDLKKADLNLPAETKDFYSEIDGRKYQLPLYGELEQPISVEEFLSIYNS